MIKVAENFRWSSDSSFIIRPSSPIREDEIQEAPTNSQVNLTPDLKMRQCPWMMMTMMMMMMMTIMTLFFEAFSLEEDQAWRFEVTLDRRDIDMLRHDGSFAGDSVFYAQKINQTRKDLSARQSRSANFFYRAPN